MDTPDDILARARDRGRAMNLPYAGALLPAEAQALREQVPGATLVDVRTQAELDWVGGVPGALHVEWNAYPGGVRNPAFAENLQRSVPERGAPVMFLCRSGARSHGAAAVAATLGYRDAFNVLEGFEGDKDAAGHRGTVGGWKHAGLPWRQS
jgi:rhodanese-related sulfurtransferase